MAGTKTNVQKSPSVNTGVNLYPRYQAPQDMSYMKMYTAANPSAMALPSATEDFMDMLIQSQLQSRAEYLPKAAQLRLEEEMRMAEELERQRQIEDMEEAQVAQNLTKAGMAGIQLLKDTGAGGYIMENAPRIIGAIPEAVGQAGGMVRNALGMESEPMMQPTPMMEQTPLMESTPMPSAPSGGTEEIAPGISQEVAAQSATPIEGEMTAPEAAVNLPGSQPMTPEQVSNEALRFKDLMLKTQKAAELAKYHAELAKDEIMSGEEGNEGLAMAYMKQFQEGLEALHSRGANLTKGYYNSMMSNPYIYDASGNISLNPIGPYSTGLAPQFTAKTEDEIMSGGDGGVSSGWGGTGTKAVGFLQGLDKIIRQGDTSPQSILGTTVSGANLGYDLLGKAGAIDPTSTLGQGVGGALAAVNVLPAAYNTYENFASGDIGKGIVSGLQTGMAAVGALQAAAPSVASSLIPTAVTDAVSSAIPYATALGALRLSGMGLKALGGNNPSNELYKLGNVIDYIFDPVGVVLDILGTWICTATKKHSKLSAEEEAVMEELANYAHANHKGWMMAYLIHGQKLTNAIEEREENLKEFYDNVREILVKPVVSVFKDNPEQAFQIYFLVVKLLCAKYMPDFEVKEETDGDR
jgi:hypothetical protein